MRNVLVLAAAFVLVVLSGFTSGAPGTVNTVTGVVVSEKTGKPVADALVYVTLGEEEALSNAKGEFKITTIRKLPLLLTAEHWDYKKQQLDITDINQKLQVRLKPRIN
ncbi:MAG: carboxypeptidase-like regulatory domain-containing protein, partial [Chitinophagaceae bacterium]|nr:carboxypeptidase-like regulatory domain-containing protein [Chitinophagaceae bacterium]